MRTVRRKRGPVRYTGLFYTRQCSKGDDFKMKEVKFGSDVSVVEDGVKNKWRWAWLTEEKEDDDLFKVWCRKIDEPGICQCIVCGKTLNYRQSGKKALRLHARDKGHKSALASTSKTASPLPSTSKTAAPIPSQTATSPSRTSETFSSVPSSSTSLSCTGSTADLPTVSNTTPSTPHSPEVLLSNQA